MKHINLFENFSNYELGDDTINGIKINESIFQDELFEYRIENRENLLYNLINWAAESKTSDRELMLSDYRELYKWEDEYIFSSISTNKFIKSGSREFDETCVDLLDLNESINSKN